jgi:3-dehydroquinate dehydratase-2
MRIAIINGPNLNLLGQREPEIYGGVSFETYYKQLQEVPSWELEYFQSNVEGELINFLQAFDGDGIVLNAGGYTHTSVALRDAVASCSIQVVEIHISNVAGRESFRHESLLTPVCQGLVMGFGLESYRLAVHYFEIKMNQRG